MSPAHYLLLNAPDRRVRATDARLRSLVAEGLHRSRTFAALVTALNHSDVIVYIESVMILPKGTMGRLTMMPRAGEYRYLRVQIRADLSRREAIALIGHELQHAMEIASATEVRDSSAMIRLYERIGHVEQRRARLRHGGRAGHGARRSTRARRLTWRGATGSRRHGHGGALHRLHNRVI